MAWPWGQLPSGNPNSKGDKAAAMPLDVYGKSILQILFNCLRPPLGRCFTLGLVTGDNASPPGHY